MGSGRLGGRKEEVGEVYTIGSGMEGGVEGPKMRESRRGGEGDEQDDEDMLLGGGTAAVVEMTCCE